MTVEKQNITEDFYIGNYKLIAVTVYEDDDLTQVKDLTGAEITYVMVDKQDDQIVLLKSSQYPAEITITDALNGECEIYIEARDTVFFEPDVYMHHMNVVDQSGREETVFTGKVTLLKSYARRPRSTSMEAYLSGG
jgi:hypothetical protein